ncbi:L-aspartate oxidase [Thermophilibacter mediterraneus]|uniref:L-aspartate oxidase n=1 Tax=Thermophilibacter mediterraneus TaxID=1871031 RepID=UPI000930DD9E|nr:L-aspartate oxidase [Thermophilibacter mediterraneus]
MWDTGDGGSVTAPSPSSHVIDCDVVIVGCGVAGLYCALNLPAALNVVLLSKGAVDECDSMLAQGGICVLRDAGDYEAFFEDTLRAGHYENRLESVDLMIRASRPIIDDLIKRGVRFARTADGDLDYTREGAHSRPRIVYHEDITGEEITTHLLACVRALPHAQILERTCMTDLIEGFDASGRRVCRGVVATGEKDERLEIHADATVFATGGVGGLYAHSTNFGCLTGDGCRVAAEHGVLLEHMDYVQIHPTTLWSERPGRAFLISESARGEGAVLLNDEGERFVDELQPRDVVSAAILAEMARTGAEHVWLSFERVPREQIEGHFTHILEHCLEEGYDIRREPIPVVPAQHYFMGGIHVDADSETTLPHLFACGETCCNGVHGRNRLASNSLLESLVFAQRAADKIMRDRFAEDTAAQLAAAARARSRFIAGSRDVTDVALLTGAE